MMNSLLKLSLFDGIIWDDDDSQINFPSYGRSTKLINWFLAESSADATDMAETY